MIGLAVTREGIPVRVWCWPGNTNDKSILPEVKDGLRGWRLGRVVTVVDRGFSSDANLDYLRRAGGHWIAGEKMRDGSPDAQAALSRQGRYQTVRDNLRVKEVRARRRHRTSGGSCATTPSKPNATPPSARRRDRADRGRARTHPARPRTRRQGQDRKGERRAATRRTGAPSARCATTPTLGRYLRQTPSGRLRDRPREGRRRGTLDGKYLLSTSDPDLSAEDVALGYKNLLEAERGFRDLKSTLELRPVFHRLEPRIRAHVLLCWLALLLIRVAERRTGTTWRRIAIELGRLHAVTLTAAPGPSCRPPRSPRPNGHS